jgi:hypothetical protein
VLAGLVGAGCSNLSGSPAQQMAEWASSASYHVDDAQIESDFPNLAAGVAEHKLLSLRTECEGFGADVETLYGELPTPDHSITDALGAALSTMYQGAEACFRAGSFTSADFARFERDLKSGRAGYEAVRRRLSALGVR